MGLAENLQATVKSILNKYAPADRQVYKRTITRVGLDALIGRSSVVSVSDELLDPQPYHYMIDISSAGRFTFEGTLGPSKIVNIGDYVFIISVEALTKEEIQDPDLLLVLVDGDGNEESFRLLEYENPSVNNTEVLYIGYFRSIKRT